MPRLRQFAAYLLAAVWLPAMLHCDLEAADIHLSIAGDHAPAAHQDTCATDSCHPIESSTYTATSPALKVLPPVANCLSILLVAPAQPDREAAEPVLVHERHPPPAEVRVGWQFISRAAPPARAPSAHA